MFFPKKIMKLFIVKACVIITNSEKEMLSGALDDIDSVHYQWK